MSTTRIRLPRWRLQQIRKRIRRGRRPRIWLDAYFPLDSESRWSVDS